MSNQFRLSMAILLALTLAGPLAAQGTPPGQGPQPPRREMGGERVLGTVASVGVDRFEVKKPDGTTQIVLVNNQTSYMEQQQRFQLEDLKPGDHIAMRGNLNSDKQFVALGVRRVTEEQLQRFQAGGDRGPGAGDRIGGDIISIDQNRIVVRNPWQGEKTIAINDQTTFSKEGQTITSKDLKVGDRIFASGKEVQGQFMATQVRTGPKGTRPERGGQPGQPPQ